MEQQKMKPHAILVPLPLQGHVIPYVQLAIKLASKGFSITFINTENIHHQIAQSNPTSPADIFADARGSSGFDIEYVTVSDGLPLEYDRSLNHDNWVGATLYCFPAHVEMAVSKIVKSRPCVCCLVIDTYSCWGSKMAKKFGLFHVSFWTEPALVLDVYFHLHLLKEKGHIGPGSDGRKEEVIDYIPGIKTMKRTDLTSYLQDEDYLATTIEHRAVAAYIDDFKQADFFLANTVHELEAQTISVIQAHIPFYAIGPLFPPGFTKGPIATSLWPESDSTQWLDTKPAGSVLYVSFGSYAHISKAELTEIANGLKLSGVNFLWVLRLDMVSSDDRDPLPVGFRDEVQDRGIIVTWTSQIAVLSHSAIGGFLTHCGWNSILESIWCQIPLLGYPLFTDQFANRKLVVDDWQIGRNLCEEKSVTKEEVSQKVKGLISGEMGCELKDNIKGIKKIIENAVADNNGSSPRNFDEFITELKAAWSTKLASRLF